MSNRLLQVAKFQDKVMIAIMKERIISRQFLFVFLGVFLFTTGLKAQGESIQVGTATRQMIVYAPAGIEQNRPLVISMHGRGQTMTDQKNQTQFQSVAQTNNFVLVFPQSNGSDWQLWGTADIDFILTIIDEMYKRYGIDRDRVYLSGFSMGGMMTYYAATQIADKIAAYAPVSGFLMDGPNTNSSRPIPIIHVHGMDDGFVPYSNVQTHIDAWVKRNGCPAAVVTNPYPANVSTSKSIKKYYGPGKEGVEVVFISVAGVGHWYSDNNWSADGIFTSQEIWNFCKKYSLKDGVPEFKYASVTDKNPKQIQVVLSKSVVNANPFNGFTVKIDNKVATIDNVVLCDTNKLAINISGSIIKDNNITLSYNNGNVVSTSYGKKLINFTDTLVDNLLKGASPQIVGLKTTEKGDTLVAKFNMKMQVPSDVSVLALNAQYNGQISIPVLQGSFFKNDSTILSFPLGKQVYRDYKLSFTYSGNNIASADNGLLKTVSDFPVTNNSNGLPVHINSGKIETDGITLSLDFSKPMVLASAQTSYFTLNINGKSATLKDYSVSNNTIQLTLSKSVHYGDTVTISCTPRDITAVDKGPLEGFSNFTIANQVGVPAWIAVPGKIEAENFTFKLGMQAETTGDVGGGQNLGYIGDGNWVEYAIENNTSKTVFQISFRLAATSSGGVIDFYVDDKYIGRVNAPNTGNWQVYQSVVSDINISQGKHYLKVVATKSGFNFNYMDIQGIKTGVSNVTNENVSIYPNPVSDELIIRFLDFQHNKIEIFDAMGKLVSSRATAGESVLHVPVHLSDGMYFVKISNAMQYQLKKFMVVNK
ncbi:MAG TPA: carbohydrate-binding protein [Paludibacter sp.]|nr:carbohydrate-binding protein [Paludibacter sp.]